MAGTRLWVQSIFVIEFFAGLWVALYIGLLYNNPDEPLLIALFPPPGREFLNNHALQYDHHHHPPLPHHHRHHDMNGGAPPNKDESFYFPRVNQLPQIAATVAVATAATTKTGSSSASAFWKKTLQKIKLPQDYILLINPKVNASLLCRDPSLLLQQQQQQQNHDTVDLYICDDFQNDIIQQQQQHHTPVNHHSRVVVISGTVFFYPPQSLSSSSLSSLSSSSSSSSSSDDSSSSQEQRIAAAAAALKDIYPTTAAADSCHDIPIHFKLLLDMATFTNTKTSSQEEEATIHDDFDGSRYNNSIHPTDDWKVWMEALNIALMRRQGLLSSFFRPRVAFSVELVSTDLLAVATRHETTTTTTTTTSGSVEPNNESSSGNNQTTIDSSSSSSTIRHEISLRQFVQSTTDRLPGAKKSHNDDDDPFTAFFYVSNLPEPLMVVDDGRDNDDYTEHAVVSTASQTVALSNRAIFRILNAIAVVNAQQDNNNNNKDDNFDGGLLVQNEAALALDQVMDFITRSCLGIDAATTTTTSTWETDGSLPHFYHTLSFQRAVQELFGKAVTAVQTQRHLVLSTSNRVPIREQHIATWQGAVDSIFHSIHLLQEMQQQQQQQLNKETSHELMMIMRTRRRLEVLDFLQQAIRLMEQMRTNPDFIDRIDFPLEQYAAIFAPLALPLAIPLLVGLIREYKRYREKQRKKDSSAMSLAASTSRSSSNDTSTKQD